MYSQVKVSQTWNQSSKYFYLGDVRATDVEILKILVDLLSWESLLDTNSAFHE